MPTDYYNEESVLPEQSSLMTETQSSLLSDIVRTEIDEAISLLTDTNDAFENIYSNFRNGDKTPDVPPVVLMRQFNAFSIATLLDELAELTKDKLIECKVVDTKKMINGYLYRYQYTEYVKKHAKIEKGLMNKYLKYIKTCTDSKITKSLFTDKELLSLLRGGLIYVTKIADENVHHIILPNQETYIKNLHICRKRVYTAVNNASFHKMFKSKLLEKFTDLPFGVEYVLSDLIGDGVLIIENDSTEIVKVVSSL